MEAVVARPDPAFWRGKRVFLTGHTGFKGAWAARMLHHLGATVTGYARDPAPGPSAHAALDISAITRDLRGDLCDAAALSRAARGHDIVLHLAAQAIVATGYADPADTWASNVTGTLNLLSALRGAGAQAAVIVTSDKVYRNAAQSRPFVESDPLGDTDPYSASKAACEVLAASHRASFADLPPLATARAGNVIGGGDFGAHRLIPDLIRARLAGDVLTLRNPAATRPFQHVFDVVAGYLLLAQSLATRPTPPALNFGPAEAELTVTALLAHWQEATGAPLPHRLSDAPPMAEKPRLALDSSLAAATLNWRPRLTTAAAVADTARWYAEWQAGRDMAAAADAALDAYLTGPT